MTYTLSVVVPVKDEEENAGPLAQEIARVVGPDPAVEIVFVDDGSLDTTVARLTQLKSEIPTLRVIRHHQNAGQSRAIRTGVRVARAGMIVTLDGDGQNDPADIPKVLAPFHSNPDAAQIGMVSGVRVKRRDPIKKRIASSLANTFRRWMLHDGAADTGCGLKAFRRDAFLALPFFDHMHRYLAALMLREGYKVLYVPVGHRPRRHGSSKYGIWDRLGVGVADIYGVLWLKKRARSPMDATEL